MHLVTDLDGPTVDDAQEPVSSMDSAVSTPPGTIVVGGVVRPLRAAFEADFFDGQAADVLACRYPGIARAYTADQWDAVFGPTLGAGETFGAG